MSSFNCYNIQERAKRGEITIVHSFGSGLIIYLSGSNFHISKNNAVSYICNLEDVDKYILTHTGTSISMALENFMYKIRNTVEVPELLN